MLNNSAQINSSAGSSRIQHDTYSFHVVLLGEYLKEQIEEDGTENQDLHQILKKRPYYVVFSLEKKLLDSHEIWKNILQEEKNRGVSILAAHEDLPKESQKIITLDTAQRNICTTLGANGGEDVFFSVDCVAPSKIADVMQMLANTSLKEITQTQAIPKMITFLDMFQTGRVEQLNPMKRWNENNPITSLAAPVGVSADGTLFTLDLHEKRQGPHGLVAGMTGSGKSEFIITYILSMAINYHPNEVAFVLIDYKGGGLAGAFENPNTGVRLPHLVGTITNLDGASIQRSLISIESELIRRQKIFNQVKSTVNEGTMDIYGYQKLFRTGKVSEPLPHLFIISDEFAELKQQQPEFMAKLISAARIGRSLGVHLILATQKPTGVVDEQIRSNTKFRVCLRVQERSDSMDMLKRPEAAELTDAGRFYLQVGYNEYFALGQSAWCGAAYEPQDTVTVQRDDTIEFLSTTGQIIAKAKPQPKKSSTGITQIVAIVKYLSDLAAAQNIHPRQLCPPELPRLLDLDKLQRHKDAAPNRTASICLGLLDDPEHQNQYPLMIDFLTCQNMLIIGENGTGKTAMLQNILYSLAQRLSPQDLNFYILDYSSRMMKLFRQLPHCGSVLYEDDADSLDEFFALINSLVAERKQLFSELEVDNFESARQLTELPLILVLIDNIAGLSSSKIGEAQSYKLQTYLRGSANYGIKYIIACNHINEVPARIRQELGDRICLHLKDKYDYGEILGCKIAYIPPELPGRGLIKFEERPLEFQSAILFADADDKSRVHLIKTALEPIRARYGSRGNAQQLSVISETATYEEFALQFKRGRIPLGYSRQTEKSLALPLKQFSILGLYFGNPRGTLPITKNILFAAQKENMELWIIKRAKDSIFDNSSETQQLLGNAENVDFLACNTDNLHLLQKAMLAVMSQHREFLEKYWSEHNIDGSQDNAYGQAFQALQEASTPVMVFIESMADFCAALNPFSMMGFRELFYRAAQRNIYIVGCFEPNIPQEVSNNSLFSIFSHRELLLFGGNLDKQTLITVPESLASLKNLPYNVALMQYREKLHPVLMPCGQIEVEEVDEDMLDIL